MGRRGASNVRSEAVPPPDPEGLTGAPAHLSRPDVRPAELHVLPARGGRGGSRPQPGPGARPGHRGRRDGRGPLGRPRRQERRGRRRRARHAHPRLHRLDERRRRHRRRREGRGPDALQRRAHRRRHRRRGRHRRRPHRRHHPHRQGPANAIAVLAAADRGAMFDPSAVFYMDKLVTGPEAADYVDINAPASVNIRRVAKAKNSPPRTSPSSMLDRPRHQGVIDEVRATGARIKLISDGDVAGSVMAVREGSGVDLLLGVGGTPEGIISACAVKCLGGTIQGKLWPRDEAERRRAHRRGPRPGPHAPHRRPGQGRQRLLRRHRHHRRRTPARRALRRRERHHGVPGHALPLPHGPPHRLHAPAVEAARLQRDRLRPRELRRRHVPYAQGDVRDQAMCRRGDRPTAPAAPAAPVAPSATSSRYAYAADASVMWWCQPGYERPSKSRRP